MKKILIMIMVFAFTAGVALAHQVVVGPVSIDTKTGGTSTIVGPVVIEN